MEAGSEIGQEGLTILSSKPPSSDVPSKSLKSLLLPCSSPKPPVGKPVTLGTAQYNTVASTPRKNE